MTFADLTYFGYDENCPFGSSTLIFVNSTLEQITEYQNLNISPTQLWTAVFADGLTFNNVMIDANNYFFTGFFITFTGCVVLASLTYPVTLTTTIF